MGSSQSAVVTTDYKLAESTPPSTSIVLPVVKSFVTQNMIACAHSSAVPCIHTKQRVRLGSWPSLGARGARYCSTIHAAH